MQQIVEVCDIGLASAKLITVVIVSVVIVFSGLGGTMSTRPFSGVVGPGFAKDVTCVSAMGLVVAVGKVTTIIAIGGNLGVMGMA